MKNSIERLLENLSPIDNGDKDRYESVCRKLNGSFGRLLWYPSSGQDYRDMLYVDPKYQRLDTYPDLFIHTDYFQFPRSGHSNDLKEGFLFRDKRTEIKVIERIDLKKNPLIMQRPEKKFAFAPEKCKGDISLFEVEINSKNLGIFRKYLLFFNFENMNFFKEVIIRLELKISHLVTIRDGSGLFGGNMVSLKGLEFFLGYLRTTYLFTDNLGREIRGLRKFENEPKLQEIIKSEKNTPVIMKGLKEFQWSNYGIFLGDCVVMKIEHWHLKKVQRQKSLFRRAL